MPRRIVLSGEFGAEHVDALCAEFTCVTDLTSGAEIELDLGQLEGLSAAALAVLVATLRKVHGQGFCDPIDHFTPPKARDLRECLSHEKLRALLNGDRSSAYHSDVPAEADICACEAFSDPEDVAHAVNDVLEHLVDQHSLEEGTLHAVNCLLSDLTQNVLQHADSGGGAIAVKMYRDRNILELAVADRGIGIRRSLAKNTEFGSLTDEDALRTALAPRLTSTPGKGRGMGLYQSKLIFTRNGGTLTVRSGGAEVTVPSGGTQAATPDQVRNVGELPSFAGTLVLATAYTGRAFDLSFLMRMLERVGGLPPLERVEDPRVDRTS
jgi:anti-sigma regulatory factor (Ser/Thr protein kinase)/ABC-type transporter Mla MlaB component